MDLYPVHAAVSKKPIIKSVTCVRRRNFRYGLERLLMFRLCSFLSSRWRYYYIAYQ
jgi:hypothetical protein